MPFAFPEDSSWSRCLSAFLADSYNRSSSTETLRIYQRALTRFFSDPMKMPEDYSREDVENFIHRPSPGGKAPAVSTVNQRLSTLNSFYSFAASYTITDTNGHPTPLLQRPAPTIGMKRGRPNRAYRAMSVEETQRFFKAINRDTTIGLRDYALFVFYLFTARRRAEIQRLCWGDIRKSTIIDTGGARREGWIYRFIGKGHSTEEDWQELPEPAMETLMHYLEVSGRVTTIQPGDPLFIPENKDRRRTQVKPLSFVMIYKIMRKYLQASGLQGRGFSVHSFRHTSARERYSAGSDIREIQKLLRHGSIATTNGYLRQLMGTSDPGAKLLKDRFGEL